MKTKFSYSLLLALVMLLSVNTFAQKSMALVDSKKTHEEIDKKMIRVYFTLTNVADLAAKQKFDDFFKATQRVTEVKSELMAGNTAAYSITMPNDGAPEMVQQMFIVASVEKFKIDGKEIETKDLAAYFNKAEGEKNVKRQPGGGTK